MAVHAPPHVTLVRRLPAPPLQAAVLLGALGLWILSLRTVDVRTVGDLGLVSVLPPTFYLAVATVTGSFCWSMRRPAPSTPLVLLQLVALVVMLYGATALIEEVPRFNVVWRHAGIIDHLARTGAVDPGIDAYFNWPSFFTLGALATELAGLESALPLAAWAPVAFNLLSLPPLVLIARAATSDARVRWVALWFFYLTNWVGQDYLATQAVAYVLYLSVLALVLTGARLQAQVPRTASGLARALGWVRAGAVAQPLRDTAGRWTAAQRVGVLLVCVVAIGATVSGHQLTPFVLILGLAALGLLGDRAARGLACVALAMTGAWLAYMAVSYLDGRLETLLDQTGNVNSAVNSNLDARVRGSTDHLVVVYVRLLLTGVLWTLAAVGAARAWRRGEPVVRHVFLGVAPLPFFVLQPYGGEMLLRVYLFTLPFAALFAARLIVGWNAARWSWTVAVRIALVSAVLFGGFLFARFGNERATLFTTEERQVVERLYELAPPGSLLVAGSPNLPWQDRRYAELDYEPLGRHLKPAVGPADPARLARDVAAYMRTTGRESAFLVVTRSQKSYEELLGAPVWGTTGALEQGIERSPAFRTLYRNRDGAVYALVDQEASR